MFSHQNGCVILCLLAILIKYVNTSAVSFSTSTFSENGLSRIKRQSSGTCNLPKINNGKLAIIRQNPNYLFLNISCDETFNLFPPNNNLAICVNGNWEGEIPQCIKCGHRLKNIFKPLVVNGTYAKFGDFPWHVAIYQTTELVPEQTYICGGSIINEKSVLTAAHCFTDDGGKVFKSRNFFIAAGKYYSSYNSESDTYAQKRKISKINIHPDYKGILSNYGWDIAVVVVDEPFEISNIVQPVCVDWTTSFENEQLVDNNFGQIVGWGATETNLQVASSELRLLSVPFVNRVQCLSNVPSDFFRYVTSDKICAGYVNGSSICNGDSGGGLVFERIENQESTYYIRGLVSLGVQLEGVCDSYKYSTYTKISTHIAFVRESITPSQIFVIATDLITKPTTPSVKVRNPFSHKNIRLLPSGNNCEYYKNSVGDKILYSFPWSVLLIYIKDGEETGFKCTGVLISKKYVLTAAHCTVGQIIQEFGELKKVRVGEEISNECVNFYRETICYFLNVEQIIRHPDFNSINMNDDIALLRLDASAVFTAYGFKVNTKPLCLPLNLEERDDDKTTFVYGWDNTNSEHDKWFKFKNTTKQETCSEKKSNLAQNQKCNVIRENFCNVLDGGIVVNEYMEPAYEFYLEGIVFSKPRCYKKRSEIEYTRISDYVLWILDNMKA